MCSIPNCWTKHHVEDHLEAPRALDIDDLLDDEETRQYIGEGNFFCVALSSKLILVKVKFVNVV